MADLKKLYQQARDLYQHAGARVKVDDISKLKPSSVSTLRLLDTKPLALPDLDKRAINTNDGANQAPAKALNASAAISFDLTWIQNEIASFRRSEFSSVEQNDDRILLIKYHPVGVPIPTQIIADHEGHIQALRYLQGILLIQENVQIDKKQPLLAEIQNAYNNYMQQRLVDGMELAAFKLADNFAKLLEKHLNVKKSAAQKQITMARDLGILLESRPDICTITEKEHQVTIEYTKQIKVSAAYYDEEFNSDKIWYRDAKKYAGLSGDTWLDSFFKSRLEDLKNKGCSAPPSARWLPLPANCQQIKTQVHTLAEPAKQNKPITHKETKGARVGTPTTFELEESAKQEESHKPGTYTETNFTRVGTLTAFELNDADEQLRIAKKIMVELLNQTIDEQIKAYKTLYDNLILPCPTFFVSYQTLLTPHVFEAFLYRFKNLIPLFKDNNGKFTDVTSEVMQQLQAEYRKTEIDLQFCHTNTAVNDKASWFTTRNSNDYHPQREIKLKATATLIHSLSTRASLQSFQDIFPKIKMTVKGDENKLGTIADCLRQVSAYLEGRVYFHPDLAVKMEFLAQALRAGKLLPNDSIVLQNEIEQRLRPSFHLRQLIDGNHACAKLPLFKRNIMMATLEAQVLGRQALNVVSCKSSRDRTGIFLGGVTAQQENPKARESWDTLYSGIMRSLKQGHYVRSLGYHVVMIKALEVAKIFMEGLDSVMQQAISRVAYFVKALPSFSAKIDKKLKTPVSKNGFGRSSTAKLHGAVAQGKPVPQDISKTSPISINNVEPGFETSATIIARLGMHSTPPQKKQNPATPAIPRRLPINIRQ